MKKASFAVALLSVALSASQAVAGGYCDVSEPTTFALAGMGLVAAVLIGRKARS